MHREPLTSSSLRSVGYHEDEEILEVEFVNDGIHQYLGVPLEKYAALMSAESHDAYFSHNIRGMYEYKEVHDPMQHS
ncbi:MAG TPA: KTSC domain-containing protein [Ohtaekwangia sp.]|nr:KTSC domain-containing protein [Ohtaekwangia sp.]